MVSVLNRGGRAKNDAAISAAIYEAVLTELGATGTIVPLGDPIYRTGATTFRSVSGVSGLETAVWTASEAPELFDTPPGRQGICPVISFNGTDEYFTSPDAAYWSNEGLSLGAWIKVSDTAASQAIIAKYDTNEAIQEWDLIISGAEKILLTLRDDSTGAIANKLLDAAVPLDQWIHVVATYDGTGGAACIDDPNCTLYVNGVNTAAGEGYGGTYTAMEDGTSRVSIGARMTGASSIDEGFEGIIAGGCAGPIFTQIELTAEQVKNIYRIQKGALAL